MQDKLSRIVAIGFKRVGDWTHAGGGIVFALDESFVTERNVLYAFVVGGELMYIGKTINSLHDRMQRYKTPAKTAAKGGSTNIKNNENIRLILGRGESVEIFALPDNGLLHYGGFHVNLAAGLEDSLVHELKPPWNGGMKESPQQSLEPTVDVSPASREQQRRE
jgi:hypothetical protein